MASEARARLRVLAFVVAGVCMATTTHAAADKREEGAQEPSIRPTLLWGLMQLVPSPEVATGSGGARFGLRWQVTPLLYSWGVNRQLSPWRGLIVEPNVRYSGSFELYVAPEYISGGTGDFGERWLVRPGVRAYVPLIQRGENLSMSIGSSFTRFEHRSSAAVEAGVYVLFGILGAQLTYSPTPGTPLEWITTLRFRYF